MDLGAFSYIIGLINKDQVDGFVFVRFFVSRGSPLVRLGFDNFWDNHCVQCKFHVLHNEILSLPSSMDQTT
jgi:hypothetical protein